MNDVETYSVSNQQQKRDVINLLNEYSPKIKWKKHNKVLDIGCGDGSVTSILKEYIPSKYELVGCDINENMVNFAKNNYSDEKTSFKLLNIEDDLPEKLKGKFDHVFSFFVLHWISDEKRAFNNIYDLMSNGGECFMIYIADAQIYDIYRKLVCNSKWSFWMQDIDRFITKYSQMQNPEKPVTSIMEEIGFTDIDVSYKDLTFTYESTEVARNAFKSICPFKIPNNLYNEFMDDYMETAEEIGIVGKTNNDETETIQLSHRLLVVHARKQT